MNRDPFIVVGRGLSSEQRFDRYARPIMGLEITNNSPEVQSLSFFSMYHRRNMAKSNLCIRSILGNTVYEDGELRMLMDYIFESRAVKLYSTVFHTNLLYGAFEGKRFGITYHRNNGEQRKEFDLSEHISKSDLTKAEIVDLLVADFHTEFSQSNIEPSERLIILFDLGNREFRSIDAVIEKANKLFGEEKRRKILLTI